MPTYGVEEIVWRVRFFDKDSGGESTPIDWRWVAIILATLFFNFSFFEVHGLDVAGFGPLAVDATVLCVAAVLITLLFFIGPALAVRATQRPVLSLLEDSIGTIPNIGCAPLLRAVPVPLDREIACGTDIVGLVRV